MHSDVFVQLLFLKKAQQSLQGFAAPPEISVSVLGTGEATSQILHRVWALHYKRDVEVLKVSRDGQWSWGGCYDPIVKKMLLPELRCR